MNEFDDLETIEAYFEERLSPEDKAAFELRYAHDADFRSEVDTYRKAVLSMSAGTNSEREEIRQLISDSEEQVAPTPKGRTLLLRTALAAAVILAVVFIWLNPSESSEISYPELAEQFAVSEPGIPVLMGGDSNSIRASMISFQSQDFKAAIKQLEQLPQNDTVTYFKGVAYYELAQYEAAVSSFDQVIKHQSEFLSDAHYRKALSKLQLGNKEEALRELQNLLVLPSSNYHLLADSLIHEIQRQ